MIPRSSRARHPWKDETNRLSVRPSSRAMRLDFPRHDFHTLRRGALPATPADRSFARLPPRPPR